MTCMGKVKGVSFALLMKMTTSHLLNVVSGNVLASKATEHLFTVLTTVLTKQNYTKEEKKSVYQEILRLDKDFLEVANETNAAIDDAVSLTIKSKCYG